MKTWIANIWDKALTSFWFIPFLMSLLAVALALTMPEVDKWLDDWLEGKTLSLVTTAASAQEFLSTLAGAMVTVAGVVISITIVTLSIASSQFGSRLLRSFLSDRITHFSLGTLIGSSVYCLFVIASVRRGDEPFIPNLTVMVALGFVLLSLGVLIAFTHHVAIHIQAPNVALAVSHDLDWSIANLFPTEMGNPPPQNATLVLREEIKKLDGEFRKIAATVEGYVQAIDKDGLMDLAKERDLVILMERRPGDFLAQGSRLARVWGPGREKKDVSKRVNSAIITGSYRTPRQDLECSIDELAELAVRALSPGINNPFTATVCIDRLGASLSRLAGREMPLPLCYDKGHHLRIIIHPFTFHSALDRAFNEIRQYGRTSASVMIRLLETLDLIARRASCKGYQAAVLRQAQIVKRAADASLPEIQDRQDVAERYRRVLKTLRRSALSGE